MPIYEYICQQCGTKFEKLVPGMSAATAIKCPECQSGAVEKIFSVFGVSRSGQAGSLGNAAGSAASCATGSA